MTKWFEIAVSAIAIVLGISAIWKRDIPVDLEDGPELFSIKGVYAVLFGCLLSIAGVYFLLKAIG